MGNRFNGGRRSSGKQRSLKRMKKLLKKTLSYIAYLRAVRHSCCTQYQEDIGQILLLGHSERALVRAEWVVIERNVLDVLDMVESYCIFLSERASLIFEQRECPAELREAVAGLVYAAAQFRQLSLLIEVRSIFESLFGKEFTDAVAERRSGCGLNSKIVLKKASPESMVRVVKEIAMEKDIDLDLAGPIPKIAQVKNPQIEPRVDENLMRLAREKYKDVKSTAQAAIESAAFSAAAATTALELYQQESQNRSSVDSISSITSWKSCISSP